MKKRYLLLLILVFALGIFALNSNIFAKSLEEQFDDLFESGSFTLNTNAPIGNDDSLYEVASRIAGYYYASESSSSNSWSSLRLSANNCYYSTMTCDFHLNREQYSNNNYTNEIVKDYPGIHIDINDSNIASNFSMVSNGVVTINYDDSLFSNDYQRSSYIVNYFNNFYQSNNTTTTQYSADVDNKNIIRTVNQNGFITSVIMYHINDFVFDYQEGAYSDEFLALTDGTLTMKSDTSITTSLLSSYIYTMVSPNNYWFTYDGEINNNKISIVRKQGNTELERHLVTLVQDTNINMTKFTNAGYGTSINIPADEPADKGTYAQNYFSNSFGYGEGESFNVDYSKYRDPDNGIVIYRNMPNGGPNTIEFHEAPIVFTGYSNTVSEQYANAVGDSITIRADELNLDSINSNIDYPLRALACNNDFSICDIAYYDYENRSVEIHKANIVFDDSVSTDFINAFNINSDNKIKIIIDNELLFPRGYSTYFSYYDDSTKNSLNFNCGSTCNLSLKNYSTGYSETHTVEYVTEVAAKTNYFTSNIKSSIDVYPGENQNFWNPLSYKNELYTADGSYNNRVENYYCDPDTNKCAIMVYNTNNQLEIHFTNVNVKTGISSEFAKVLSGDTVKFNAIYKNDSDYIDNASLAYLINKTKDWTYLTDYNGTTGKIVYDDIEAHTKNVEFATGNNEHKAIVDDAVTRVNNANVEPILDDMEYVNYFYYNKGFSAGNNFDSKTLNDTLSNIINNKHISYFYVVEGGGGCPFQQGYGGKLVLYYDGIGYGVTNNVITTLNNIIYVPDNTADTKEAFIQAAQKRITDYLGNNSNVFIEFSRQLSATDLADIPFDYTGSDGNAYNLIYNGKVEEVLIIKNSSKMKSSTFAAKDVTNNVNVTSDNANYPSNTIVTSDKISTNDNKYKDVLKELKVEDAEIIDINLFSPVYGYMTDFNNVDFDVSVPVDTSKFNNNKLYAYYIDDDGRIEEHAITMDDFMANFETDHFSTYVITEKISSKAIENHNNKIASSNPGTGDNIYTYVLLLLISTFGFVRCGIYYKKNY